MSIATGTITVLPRHFRGAHFMGSPFRKSEMETMLSCIAITQHRMNPDLWTPFTWDEYVAKCDHKPTNTERLIFDAMVDGGEVWINAGFYQIESGYLTRDDAGRYMVSEKLLALMAPYKC